MVKKNTILISLILFLTSCGFTPIYIKNNNVNFSIEQVNFIGDRELNNFIKTNLYKYKNKEKENKIFIEVNSEYQKTIISKDSTGEVTNYQLEANVVFSIKSSNKVIKINEKKIMKNMDDKFEENNYEKSTKQSFASSITNKLISELLTN
jgi:outer membrane lipopolysaccharide assembly protein LptE/RlpB